MDQDLKNQKGFGLVEALASMFILALLFTAVMMMNYTNHNAAMRIATRNEATLIGHRIMDSLQVLGVSQVHADTQTVWGDTAKTVGSSFKHQYTWMATVTNDTTRQGPTGMEVIMIRAKKVDLKVRWTLSGHTNEITFTTVVE